MSDTHSHLATWEAAGLIDPATAERIRAWQLTAPAEASRVSPETSRRPSAVSAIFGPGIGIGELFGYLGAIFLLAATDAFIVRIAGAQPDPASTFAVGASIQAAILLAVGYRLRGGDQRRSRAAGVAFLLASIHAGVAGGFASEVAHLGWPVTGIVAAGSALAVAGLVRRLHPGLLTQTAVLGSITCLAGAILAWLEQRLIPPLVIDSGGSVTDAGPDPLLLVLGSAAWWLATAIVVGLIGLREARQIAGDPTATRRAGLTRLWAGSVAVGGLASAVTRTDVLADGGFGRVVEPWVGELAILVLAAILIERAFRRDDSAFVYPAALGVIIALTDFNVSYLAEGPEVGLFVEGLILLAVGFSAQRLRRMIGSSRPAPTDGPDGGEAVPGPTVEPAYEGRSAT
ncbi:MAG TPA: hypothetical protein VHK05_02725 [Candidatus Limnocylindrales bacterium]|jgi:hypothetical protein|nr:hypothetical protein [Candidatus Limnocylindrales bacterium]